MKFLKVTWKKQYINVMVGAINGKLVHRSEFEGLKKKWYLEIH